MKNITLLLLLILASVACTKETIPESTVNISTNTLAAFSIQNNTKYLIVFESGLGDDHKVWNQTKIATSINAKEDILMYDRAGYEKSTKGPAPRDIKKLSSELETVNDKFAYGRKVILVGHSIGGMIIRDYTIKNPNKTAALLFIDPSHENYNSPTQAQEKLIALVTGIKNKGARVEAMELMEDFEYSAALPNLPNVPVPVIVLTSMKNDENNANADKANRKTREDWYNAHEKLGNGLSDFTHIATKKAGHYIFLDEPKLVLENLDLLISKLPQ